MAPARSFSNFVYPTITFQQLIVGCLLLSLLPSVLGTCAVTTFTETAWVTVTATPGDNATKSTAALDSTQTIAVPELSTSSVGDAQSPTLLPTSGVPSSATSVQQPPVVPSSGRPLATYNPLPKPAPAMFAPPSNFNRLTPTPNMGSIRNSCGYDVYVWSVGCGDPASNVKIAAGTTWSEKLRRCKEGGVVYKVSKFDGNTTNVMQFEAGVWFDKDIVQYDLSYLNCMVPGTTDLSACAGWEGGHQVVAGKKCQVFVCNPGEYCDGMSYTVGEYGYQSGGVTHPNAGCDSNQGIAFELCACSKH